MPIPSFLPREKASDNQLLVRILERVQRDLPDAVGLAITVHERGHDPETTVVAARGFGREIVQAQLDGLGGPVVDAVTHQIPVLSLDLWSDDRWPDVTLDAVAARHPEHSTAWRQMAGSVAVPGVWEADATVVLSCTLNRPATAATVNTLVGYEQLIFAAMLTSGAQDGTAVADMMAVLQSRGAIEQAKGAIMGCLRCDAETAWNTLRRASHESNVKLRTLAVALMEHVGGSPAEQPAAASPIVPDEAACKAAGLLWAVLTHAPKPVSAGN